ncbi:MAG: ISKra4 family transposase [Chloroflexi bacterium]|nr:ISKra4 family transposase [Chloroflexota bacterium]
MCSSPPLDILAQVSALGAALVAQARQSRGAPLADLEPAVRTVVQAALPALLRAVLHLATPDLDPGIATVHRRCPRRGCQVRMHSQRPRTLQTTRGPLVVVRPWYHCPACHQGFSPADAALALPARARISAALEAWLVRLNVSTTQREAAALLTELTGPRVGMDTIREHTTAVGDAVAAADEAAIRTVQTTGASAAPVVPVPGQLVVETDGAMVRYDDGWHEVKIGVVGGVVDGAVTAASSVAARESAEVFGPRLLAETARRGALEVVRWEGPLTRPGLAVLPPVHVVGDGAHWIWTLAEDHFGDRTEVVDFYHAAEHVWTVARALYGEGTPEATAWAQARIEELKKEGGRPVHAALFAITPPTEAATEVLRVERGYFTTNLMRMAYPDVQARGLPIGSGAVESAAKHVVQHRMKRPGQRWTCQGGRAMLALRARFASGRPLHACVSSTILQH